MCEKHGKQSDVISLLNALALNTRLAIILDVAHSMCIIVTFGMFHSRLFALQERAKERVREIRC